MTDAVFNDFIESVYGGGSAMEFFDGGDSSFEVVGGVDDITVESIFGGRDMSASDSESDSESDDTEGGISDSESEDTEEESKEEVINDSKKVLDETEEVEGGSREIDEVFVSETTETDEADDADDVFVSEISEADNINDINDVFVSEIDVPNESDDISGGMIEDISGGMIGEMSISLNALGGSDEADTTDEDLFDIDSSDDNVVSDTRLTMTQPISLSFKNDSDDANDSDNSTNNDGASDNGDNSANDSDNSAKDRGNDGANDHRAHHGGSIDTKDVASMLMKYR